MLNYFLQPWTKPVEDALTKTKEVSEVYAKKFTNAVSDTAYAVSSAADSAAAVAYEVVSGNAKVRRDYDVTRQTGTGGPGGAWRIYAATSKKKSAIVKEVSVWVLDKKRFVESHQQTLKSKVFEPFFEQQRKACQAMTRLKHPGVVKVVEQLDENANQMCLITEPVLCSMHNVLTRFKDVPGPDDLVQSVSPSEVDLKHNLLHLTETLHFLHTEAHIAHCGVSPASVMLTTTGVMKLADFCYVITTDYASPILAPSPYTYDDPHEPVWVSLTKPALQYTAPELVGGPMAAAGQPITPAVDVFSLAALAAELLSGSALLGCGGSTSLYLSCVKGLAALQMPALAPALAASLRPMLHASPTSRPPASSLLSSPYFQDDMLLRALRFLDTLLQRDALQKAAFVRDLATFWQQFDARVLKLKVLPPLIQELRVESMQMSIAPVVMSMLQVLGPVEFVVEFLPVLRPIMEAASGDLLLLLLQANVLFSKLMSTADLNAVLLPMHLRALDTMLPQQEQAVKNLQDMSDSLDYEQLKSRVLPKLLDTCQRTTSAQVRSLCLAFMAKVVPRFDEVTAELMLDTCIKVAAVDKCAGTLVGVLQVCQAISSQHSATMLACHVLPLLCPFLTASSLRPAQLLELLTAIRGMLDCVQAKVLPEGHAQAATAAAAGAPPAEGGPAAAAWDTPITTPSSSSSKKAMPAASPAYQDAMQSALNTSLVTKPAAPVSAPSAAMHSLSLSSSAAATPPSAAWPAPAMTSPTSRTYTPPAHTTPAFTAPPTPAPSYKPPQPVAAPALPPPASRPSGAATPAAPPSDPFMLHTPLTCTASTPAYTPPAMPPPPSASSRIAPGPTLTTSSSSSSRPPLDDLFFSAPPAAAAAPAMFTTPPQPAAPTAAFADPFSLAVQPAAKPAATHSPGDPFADLAATRNAPMSAARPAQPASFAHNDSLI